MSRLPIDRPLNLARDLGAMTFENVDISLFDLYSAHQAEGAVIGRTFTGCRLQGPAVILVADGTSFDETNFGDPRGDMRNLLLQPMGPKALGTIPMRNCRFIGCEFYNVAFTGGQDILDQLAAVPSVPETRQ